MTRALRFRVHGRSLICHLLLIRSVYLYFLCIFPLFLLSIFHISPSLSLFFFPHFPPLCVFSFFLSQETTLSALSSHDTRLIMGDMIVEKMHIHFGSKDKNPVDRMRFYEKESSKHDENSKGSKIDEIKYEASMPRYFEEMNIRLFCKDPEKVINK